MLGLVLVGVLFSSDEEPSSEPLTASSVATAPPSVSGFRASLSEAQGRLSVRSERKLSPRPEPAVRSASKADSADTEGAAKAERELMVKLRQLGLSDPIVSLELARAGHQRFADSPDAPERTWFEARALVDLQRFDEARAVAEQMVESYPDSDWTRDVQRHLLSHPFGLPPRPR